MDSFCSNETTLEEDDDDSVSLDCIAVEGDGSS